MRLRHLSDELGARNPHRLGDQLTLLMEGAYSYAIAFDATGLKGNLVEAVQQLIDGQIRSMPDGDEPTN